MKLGEIIDLTEGKKDVMPGDQGTWNYPSWNNIERWLFRFFKKPYVRGLITINDKLELDVRGTFHFKRGHLKKMGNTYQIPFQFNDVTGDFIVAQVGLGSLKNSPRRVGGSMYCWSNNIQTLDGAPEFIKNTFQCDSNNIRSLHNIHKQIRHIGRHIFIANNPIKDSVLGLLKINGLKESLTEQHAAWSEELAHVFQILENHRGTRDIHACQEEMLEAGLGKFAKL